LYRIKIGFACNIGPNEKNGVRYSHCCTEVVVAFFLGGGGVTTIQNGFQPERAVGVIYGFNRVGRHVVIATEIVGQPIVKDLKISIIAVCVDIGALRYTLYRLVLQVVFCALAVREGLTGAL
jgi:hypothetical protein